MRIRYIVISLLFLFSIKTALAQEKVEVSTEQKEMSQGLQTAFSVFIPESEPKMVEKEWKKFINERSFFEFATKGTSQTFEKAFMEISNVFSKEKKTFAKNSLKVVKVGDELVVKNVIHEDLTNTDIDVFARITGTEKGVYLSSFLKYSDSIFINTTNITEDAQTSILNYIRVFGIETYRKVVGDQIEEEKTVLRKQEGELKDLERKNKSLHKSIGRDEANIDEYEYNITTLVSMLPRIEEKIQLNKKSLNQAEKKSLEYENYNLIKKDLKNERKKNLNKTKSFKKKIKRNQTDISKANSDIIVNEKDQEYQIEVIDKQEMRVLEFENKLANIK